MLLPGHTFKQLFMGMVHYTPSPLIKLAYKVPFLARIGSRLLKGSGSAELPIVVTIRQGPLAGKKLLIDHQTPHYYWIKGHDEPEVVHAMHNCIKPGQIAVDVGAHIGIETLMLSQWVGPDGQVVSIEPDPGNCKVLTTNLRLNAVSNVEVMQVAVSDRRDKMQFIQGKGLLSRLAGDLDLPASDPESRISVQVNTLDELFTSGKPTVDFVKIDVEDSEAAVLHGAHRLLFETKPIVLIELHSYRSARGCADILNQAGYKMELIDTPESDIGQYLATQPQADYQSGFGRCHLLATPLKS
jgi:FkbM family methyltransferase